jgi:putative acetyltransferase
MVIIRPEQPEDIEAIREVNVLAFGREQEARLIETIRETADFVPAVSLVALRDGTIVGHALFSRVAVELAAGTVTALSLGPIAVRPEHQRQGVGAALIRHGLAEGRRLRYPFVVVIGHPAYYPRFGFVPARSRGLEVKYPVPNDVFMVAELAPGALDRSRGLVHYPSAFDGL